MKKISLILISVILLLALVVGCGSQGSGGSEEAGNNQAADNTPEPAEQKKQLRVGLLTSGDINDNGWNAMAYDGLLMIEKELGAEISVVTNVQQSDMQSLFREYGANGFDYVIGHGNQYSDAAKAVAPEFPNTRFIINSSTVTQEPNLISCDMNAFQEAFLEGIFATKFSKNKKIGFIGGIEQPSTINNFNGFKTAVAYADPEAEFMGTYIGSVTDAAKAKEIALTFINQGVDALVAHCAGAVGGVYEAASEHPGVIVTGATRNRYEEAPTVIPISTEVDLGLKNFQLVKAFEDGSLPFEVKVYTVDIESGGIRYVDLQGHWKEDVPADIWEYVKKVEKAIKDGQLDVGPHITDASQIPQI